MADVTQEFIGRQLEQLINRVGAMEDQITVLTGMMIRFEGAVQGLTVEVRGIHSWLSRLDARVRKLEEAP